MVGHRLVAIGTAYAVLAAPLLADAQCKADVDCKGDRVCESGQCVDPKTKQPDAPPPPPPKKDDDGVKVTIRDAGDSVEDGDTGWAMAGGIIGVVAAAATIGLAVGAELTKEDKIPSLPLGAAATVLVAAAGPITFVAGGSARRAAGATGLFGLRITGWIAYGISLALAISLIYLGVLDATPPTGLISATGALGALSLVFFAIDAFVSHSEAAEGSISDATLLTPTLVWSRANDGGSVPGLGLAGRF